MNPMIQSRSSRSAWDRLSQIKTHGELSAEFNSLIGSLIPFEAELYLPATKRKVQDDERTSIKSNSDYVQELAQRLTQPQGISSQPERSIFALPMVHAGKVEAVCCLKPRLPDVSPISPPQIFDLISICDIAAKAIARLNKTNEDARKNSRSHEAADSVPQRSLSPIFSKVMGSVAHDLRTPITVIRGFIKMILDGRTGTVSDAQKKCLDVALESVNRLVEFSGTVGGAAAFLENFQSEDFEVREIWNSVASAVRPQLDEKGVTVSEFIEPGLLVSGDRGLLFEVIEKSILAMSASVRCGGRLRIEISRRASGDVSFQISLPEEQNCANPAEVVTQLHSVVLLHGGRLSFTTKPESGAVLNLILPGCTS